MIKKLWKKASGVMQEFRDPLTDPVSQVVNVEKRSIKCKLRMVVVLVIVSGISSSNSNGSS